MQEQKEKLDDIQKSNEKYRIEPGLMHLPNINGYQFKYFVQNTNSKQWFANALEIKVPCLSFYYQKKHEEIPANLKLMLIEHLGKETLNLLFTEYCKVELRKQEKEEQIRIAKEQMQLKMQEQKNRRRK
jgi:hypothetical protein